MLNYLSLDFIEEGVIKINCCKIYLKQIMLNYLRLDFIEEGVIKINCGKTYLKQIMLNYLRLDFIEEGVIKINCDKTYLKQIMLNYLSLDDFIDEGVTFTSLCWNEYGLVWCTFGFSKVKGSVVLYRFVWRAEYPRRAVSKTTCIDVAGELFGRDYVGCPEGPACPDLCVKLP